MKSLTYFLLVSCLSMCVPQVFATPSLNDPTTPNEVQRVRINVTTPMGYTRHLLLGFTPDNAASDGFDYGYDAANPDNYNNDCSWLIESQPYVIQGVGQFNQTKAYPLGLFLSDDGNVEFSIQALENFETDISVYIYDTFNDVVVLISEQSFTESLQQGNYTNRFYITFTNDINAMSFADVQLSVDNKQIDSLGIRYVKSNNQIELTMPQAFSIQDFHLYSVLGKEVMYLRNKQSLSSGKLLVDLQTVSAGIYIVSLQTQFGNLNKRIVISK